MDFKLIRTTVHQFFNQIMPVYPTTVPFEDENENKINMPYLSYTLAIKGAGRPSINNAIIWTHSSSFNQLAEYESKLAEAIPENGVVIFMSDGSSLRIYRDESSEFIQSYPQDDPNIKASYVNYVMRVNAL